MIKWLVLFSGLLGMTSLASVLHTEQLKSQGAGCSGMSAIVETINGKKELVIRFEALKASILGRENSSNITCDLSIPFEVNARRSLRVYDPVIVGSANMAAHVDGVLNFEMAWPDHRGPNYQVGYKNLKKRVTEDFADKGEGTEIQFGCGENTDLVISAGASLEGGWFYGGETSEIQTKQLRLSLEDVVCQ